MDDLPANGDYSGAIIFDIDNDGDNDLITGGAGWSAPGLGMKAWKTDVSFARPVPDAGPDQTVLVGQIVTLAGTATGTVEAFKWNITSQPSGSTIVLSDDTIGNPTFTPNRIGDYVLTLAAMDDDGDWNSVEDSVTITADPLPNVKPTAKAGSDFPATNFDVVQLDGSASTDDSTPPRSTSHTCWRRCPGPASASS